MPGLDQANHQYPRRKLKTLGTKVGPKQQNLVLPWKEIVQFQDGASWCPKEQFENLNVQLSNQNNMSRYLNSTLKFIKNLYLQNLIWVPL